MMRDIYFSVNELTLNEKEELKNTYYFDLYYGDDAEQEQDDYINCYGELPDDWDYISDDALERKYGDISFVDEDFWCNIA